MAEELWIDKIRGRVAIAGVGDLRRGDDGAGPAVARLLAEAGTPGVFDCGSAPEIETWRIREYAPETVVFVDAVDFGGAPGELAFLEVDQLRSEGFDAHRAPLRLTMQYLELELGVKCYLLGIQPADVRFGAPMCQEVKRTVDSVVGIMQNPDVFGEG